MHGYPRLLRTRVENFVCGITPSAERDSKIRRDRLMEWTDRHCRYFHRLLTRHALIYTEMVTTGAVLHGDRARLLGFDPFEHPVAVQLGGSEPSALAASARIGEDFGYNEIN